MQYFAANKNFDRVKVNFTQIYTGRRALQYFDIYSVTNTKLIVKLGDMNNYSYSPGNQNLAIYDFETNIKIA